MIDKIEDSKFINKLKITFDYFRIIKLFFETHLKLNLKIHDHLSNFKYKCLFFVDLKHAYFIISLHFKNKHYFVFTISDIKQIQSTRM